MIVHNLTVTTVTVTFLIKIILVFLARFRNLSYLCSRKERRTRDMELQTVKIGNENIVASDAQIDGITIRRTGIAKVLWRKLNTEVPQSEIIIGGVETHKG